MRDIIITCAKNPKKGRRRIDSNYCKNFKGKYICFKIPREPRNKNELIGKRCYVGYDHYVIGYFIIGKIRFVEETKSVEWADWDGTPGFFVFCKNKFEDKIIHRYYERGNQGFQYWDRFISKHKK